ncbi:hypothetical protein Tco_0041091 [Tanacetum coccineum]
MTSNVILQESKTEFISLLSNGIENKIDARAHLEKELLIKERDVKQGWEHEKSKDASEIDNNVARDFHDKDNITEVQKIETFKERVRDLVKKPDEFIYYKIEYEKLQEISENRFHFEKQNIKIVKKQKDKLQDQFFKEKGEFLNAKNEIDSVKKAFKQKEDKYLNDIIQLEAKNKDLENTVCKMGNSSKTLCMLTNEQSLYQENKRKKGLGYTDPCPLGQAIACHPKLYDAEVLGLHYMKPDVHDTKEILNDAEASQVKMKEKQFQFNYENINSLYDTFVPQTELSPKQEYFSIPPTSNNSSESKDVPSESSFLKMPKESRLLKMFDTMGDAITGLHTRINNTLLQDAERRWLSDSQNELRKFYKTDVISMSRYLYKNLKQIKEELIEEVQEILFIQEFDTNIKEELTEEVQEMLNIYESMESKFDQTSKKNEILQNKIDQLLEANIVNEVRNLIMQSYVEIKNKEGIERFSKGSKDGDTFCNDVVEVKEKLTAKFEAYFEKLENTKVVLERQLARKVDDSKAEKD